ncbi:MAG TPA: PAS domain-containing sensor histidine kinase [Candidatus Limnocylindria bacterium]
MRWLLPDRRAVVGAAVGVTTTLLGSMLAGTDSRDPPYTVVLVLAIALVGLALGAAAAAWAWLAGVAVLTVIIVTSGVAPDVAASDVIRLTTFIIGSPFIVLLVRRVEIARATAAEALEASRASRGELAAERERLVQTRADVDAALEGAERERARLEEVAEAIPEPLIVYDDQLAGTYGNRAALRLFGRSFVERPLDDWGRATEPRDERGQPLPRDEWPQVVARGEALRRRLTLRIPMSGRDVLVDVEGTPIPGGGAVLLLRDVGKEEAERRRLSRFASFVAHELRNPLAVAKARIELAQRDPNLSQRAGGHATRALESVDAAIGILERLELYSRADSGSIEATRDRFDLAPAVGAAIERLRTRGSEREVLVALGPTVSVLGDRHLSEQAITNLLTNADRYSSPGAPIRVEITDGEQVTLRVRDEGPGIADEVADRLFHDRVAAGRGLGLGLYLVHATMSAMGGSVVLEQRRPAAVFALRWARAEGGEPAGDGATA